MTKFGVLAGITALGVFGLIIMGGVVRVSGSGLGCPDWPLCHGEFTPPLERTAIIEYSHRSLVAAESLLIVATAFVAWRNYRQKRWVFWPALVALVLLFAQAGLGGATVKNELNARLVTAHLGLALIFFASTVITALSLRRPARLDPNSRVLLPWLAAAALSLFVTMLIGAYIGSSGAGLACPDLPICDGTPVPLDNHYVQAHLWHRSFAMLTTLLVFVTVFQAWRLRLNDRTLKIIFAHSAAAVLFQVFLGAVNVWLKTPDVLVVAHLANGAFLWSTLVAAGLRIVRSEQTTVTVTRRFIQPARMPQ